jgi:hypothetical protein
MPTRRLRSPGQQNRRAGNYLPFHELPPPPENGIGASPIEPCGREHVGDPFAVEGQGAKGAPRLGRVAALVDRFRDMGFELFSNSRLNRPPRITSAMLDQKVCHTVPGIQDTQTS